MIKLTQEQFKKIYRKAPKKDDDLRISENKFMKYCVDRVIESTPEQHMQIKALMFVLGISSEIEEEVRKRRESRNGKNKT